MFPKIVSVLFSIMLPLTAISAEPQLSVLPTLSLPGTNTVSFQGGSSVSSPIDGPGALLPNFPPSGNPFRPIYGAPTIPSYGGYGGYNGYSGYGSFGDFGSNNYGGYGGYGSRPFGYVPPTGRTYGSSYGNTYGNSYGSQVPRYGYRPYTNTYRNY